MSICICVNTWEYWYVFFSLAFLLLYEIVLYSITTVSKIIVRLTLRVMSLVQRMTTVNHWFNILQWKMCMLMNISYILVFQIIIVYLLGLFYCDFNTRIFVCPPCQLAWNYILKRRKCCIFHLNLSLLISD